MNTKEKAWELVQRKYSDAIYHHLAPNLPTTQIAKICALICVEEMIKLLETLNKPEYTSFLAKDIYTIAETEYDTHIHGYELIEYWNQVKQEIEKL